MYSNLQLAICISALVGAVWASPFELDVRASNSSTASNATTATTPTLRPSGSITLPSSNSTISSSTATPSFSNSSPVSAFPLSSYVGDAPAKIAEYAEKCHRTDYQEGLRDGNFVFCQPMYLQNVTVSETYPFVWDPRAFESNATNTISLNYVDDPNDGPLIFATNVSNSKGYALIEMAEKWLREGKSNNLTVFITSLSEGSNKTISGPTIVLIPDKDSSPSKKKPSKVGLGVGIPFAFGAVAIIALGAFCCIRKRRRTSKGFLASKSRGHQVGAMPVEEDDFIGGTRGPGRFRDEPSGGLELQDRSRGRGRQDSLGSLTSTPTEDSGRQGEGRNNAFRDEISRQRTLRA